MTSSSASGLTANRINMFILGHIQWCSARDFSITVQPISKQLAVKGWFMCFVFYCNPWDIFAHWPRKWDSGGPAIVCALRKWLFSYYCRVEIAHNSRYMCVHKRFQNKLYQTLYTAVAWDECRRVLHCPTNWCASCYSLSESQNCLESWNGAQV